MQFEAHGAVDLSLFCVVCDRDRRDKVLAVLEGHKSFFNLGLLGKGTANSKMLGYLGLGETEKAVFFSIMPTHVAMEAMAEMDDSLVLGKAGHGIAFTSKIREGCYHKPVQLSGENDGGEKVDKTASEHELIMAVMNRGYTEEVMDVARRAGARGGTVLHARGCGLEGAEKFFGITIQPEKEIILMITPAESSCGIMSAMADEVGPGTDAGAVSFALPVTAVRGLSQNVLDKINK